MILITTCYKLEGPLNLFFSIYRNQYEKHCALTKTTPRNITTKLFFVYDIVFACDLKQSNEKDIIFNINNVPISFLSGSIAMFKQYQE